LHNYRLIMREWAVVTGIYKSSVGENYLRSSSLYQT